MNDPDDDEDGESLLPNGTISPAKVAYTAVSDLFFAMDHSDAELYDGKHNFRGYDPKVLHSEAEFFLSSLRALGVKFLPTEADLVQDFYDRT